MTTNAPALPSTERLLELAVNAEVAADTMHGDCEDFMARMPTTKAAAHYALVIQQQTDTATALRALVKARELAAKWAELSEDHARQPMWSAAMARCSRELTTILGAGSETN